MQLSREKIIGISDPDIARVAPWKCEGLAEVA